MLEMRTLTLRLGMPSRGRRLGQTPAPACPNMTQEGFDAASKLQTDAWSTSGKNTLVSVCATVNGRIMQECRFPDGYASAQNVAATEAAPPTCEVQWAQRQSAPAMQGRRLAQAAAPGAAKAIGDADFGQVLAAPKAVAMFYSPNCPYSRAFMPIYQGLAAQNPDVLFATVNVDQYIQNAGKYKTRMLPTVVFFVNGQEVGRIDGVQEQSDFVVEMSRAFAGQAPAAAATAAAPPRGGTLVESSTIPTPSAVPIILGSVAALGLLGAIGYAIFGK
jgi:thiol-disulfide isomerase/thioredoxin